MYSFNQTPVSVPRGAEVSAAFQPKPDAAFSDLVQAEISAITPWEGRGHEVRTFDLPVQIGARVLELSQEENPVWMVNPHHKARNTRVSPFIILGSDDERRSTAKATIEIVGQIDRPMLTRAYPGEYMPPLPWLNTANKVRGGIQESLAYWRKHAFIISRAAVSGRIQLTPPDWYENISR